MNAVSKKGGPYQTSLQKTRQSNLELFRIITMLLIIAHHYVVNSGLTHAGGPVLADPTSWKSIALVLIGAWGKTGINCFVIITGYFMCKSHITAKKFAKLLLEIEFYSLAINAIFWITGYSKFSLSGLLKAILPVISVDSNNFTACFLVFFLFIPFLNILVQNMSQKMHFRLIVLCLFLYTFLQTVPFFGFKVVFNYVSWFSVLYFISSYVRMYPNKIFDKTWLWGVLTLVSFGISAVSVLFMLFKRSDQGIAIVYEFVMDSNTLLALTNGFCAFMFFKNIKMGYSKFINTVAASTFGVFLIHTCGNAMRSWLWKDTLNNVGWYKSPYIILHLVCSVLGIFIICTVIDWLRIQLLEKPFFKLWDKKWDGVKSKFERAENKLFKFLHISQEG